MTWTARAEEIAETAREAGLAASGMNAAAWAAGVAPEATYGIVGAAVALGAPVAPPAAGAKPLRDDKAMLESASDLEGSLAEMLRDARAMRQQAAREHDDACDSIARLQREKPYDALYWINVLRRRVADCECAVECLDEIAARLGYAGACLSRVPDDLEATYEVPYSHVRRGGALPHSGDWLTGSPVLEGSTR